MRAVGLNNNESSFMLYALRAVYLTVHFLAVCAIALPVFLLRPRYLNNTTQLATLMSWSLPLLGVRMIRNNESPVRGKDQAIYVVNHQDTLDVFICTGMLPEHIAILGKSSLKYIPLFGLVFWLAGNIFINRRNKTKAWNTMAEVARIVKRRGCSVYVFPEGTRSRGQGMLPFKTGAFVLAIESGLPVVPIVFSSTHKHVDLNRWRGGVVMAEYLDPIDTTGMSEADVKPLLDLTRTRMLEAQARLDNELAAIGA